MTTPLRVGFLLSGLLHIAVVAAFSLLSKQDIPAVDEPRPLTLNLALFKPAQAAPVPLEEPRPEPEPRAVEASPQPPPPDRHEEIVTPVEPRPVPVAKTVEPQPVVKPRKVVKRVSSSRPVTKKRVKARPVNPKRTQAKPVKSAPAPSPPATLVRAADPQPVTAAVDAQERRHYLAALAAKINRSKYYPLGSRRRGEEGRVVVRFVVQRNGELTEITVVESSGSKRLDAAALKTVRRVTPFRPIPEVLDRDHWPISVPIAFSLSG